MEKNKDNKFKEKNMSIPIENQKTAAYYNIKGLTPKARVTIPTLSGVIEAKKWVEENQK